jgi:hypothetical protein
MHLGVGGSAVLCLQKRHKYQAKVALVSIRGTTQKKAKQNPGQ